MKNVIITDGTVKIRGTINDTLAARDFEKRLPFTCSGYDSGIDYCCSAPNGLYDPLETQIGWKNGDISLEGDKVVQKGVYAKMARGEMVRFMAGIHAETPEQIKDFNWSGYHFDEGRSSDIEYVFIRTEVSGKGKR